MDEKKLVKAVLKLCRSLSRNQLDVNEATEQLRALMSIPTNAGLVFDTLFSFGCELDARSSDSIEFKNFLASICDKLLPKDVLVTDISLLGADDQHTKSRVIKCKTRLYYKQIKFNLFREECEGYAKLISELLSIQPTTTHDAVLHTVESLIGQFNLDPNRVVDVVLDCFECTLRHRHFFIHLMRKFILNKEDLRDILSTKFAFCKSSEYTSTSLYKVASILCQEGLIDVNALFSMVTPTQSEILEEVRSLSELTKARSAKAEVVSSAASYSTTSSSTAVDSMLMSSGNENNVGGDPEPSVVASVSLSAAVQSQLSEDRKLAGNKFDDSTVLVRNQKLGLVCALLEHGAWDIAKDLLNRFPDVYALGLCKRIPLAIANIIGFQIELFYRKICCADLPLSNNKMKESWDKFISFLPQVSTWQDIFTHVYPILMYLGPYIGMRHDVAVKLIRLFAQFFEEEESKRKVYDFAEAERMIMDVCDYCLLPATSLLDSNYAYCEELWQVLQRFLYQDRYRLYNRWRNVHADKCWDLLLQKGRVMGMTRYVVKRLSKESAKVMGRQLGKLSHTYPMVVFEYLLDKVQDFQNFIEPVVDAIRFMSLLEFDVLSYCLIESLADPEKQDYKIADLSFSPWLLSLAMFAGNVYKKYSIDFAGILQYIVNQLKQAKGTDLIVLREIVATISGVEHSYDITKEHLEALCGGETLRGEVGYSLASIKTNRRATSRLRDSLLKNDLFESICILLSQQKNHIVFYDCKEYPIKLTTQMLDHCQETFLQFFYFIRSNLRLEEYGRRLPSAPELITKFKVPPECAMCLIRPIYINKINISYEQGKKAQRESSKSLKLDTVQKTSLYVEAFTSILISLEEEIINIYPEMFWTDLTARLYSTFWLLSISDISAPTSAYEREIEKYKLELDGLKASEMSKTKRAKDEERLKALEQKLSDELRRQNEHVKRVCEVISSNKEVFFAQLQNRSSQMLRFLQSCILPRTIFSEIDAIFCASFIEKLHSSRVEMFQTIVFFDKILSDVMPILSGLTERETSSFGLFCNISLELIMRWHSSRDVFDKECLGFPGCIIKFRKADPNQEEPKFNYEHYRSICHKWQVRLVKSLSFMLANTNDTYVMIRNALTFMLKILPNFPILQKIYNTIEQNVTLVRDNEKGKRSDLNLLASSYLVQLAKRNVKLRQEEDFHNPNFMKTGTNIGAQQRQSAASSTNASSGVRKLKYGSSK